MQEIQSRANLLTILFLVFSFAGCQPPATNSNGTTTVSNAIGATNSSAATNTTASSAAAAIETREPERYQATVTLRVETLGEKSSVLPPFAAEVARDGASQRMEFAVPNGEKVIYLDRADKRLLVLPNRKQFAELNKESVGVDVRQLFTPGQIVARVKNLKGVERVGEEQVNGRAVTKYRYNATTNTNSQAGNVATESFVLVDEETGLPLRSETVSQSQNGTTAQGLKGVRLVTEMSNIRTDVSPELFVEPKDYKQVAPEEVRNQVNAIFSLAMGVLGQALKNPQQQQPNNSEQPSSSQAPPTP